MPELHPTILEADGKPAFVVLPFAEYAAMRAALADAAWNEAFAAETPEAVERIRKRIAAQPGETGPLFDKNGELAGNALTT